jgi:hypothetical protein
VIRASTARAASTPPHQPARRLRLEVDADHQRDRRHQRQPERVAPLSRLRESQVDQVGDENAAGDHQLVQPGQRAAYSGRRDLGQVDRHGHGQRAHGEAHHEAAAHDDRQVRRERRDQAAEPEHGPGHHHQSSSPDRVGEPAAAQRADHAADQQRTRHEPDLKGVEAELGFDQQQRTGDHAEVVTEQQAAQRTEYVGRRAQPLRRAHPPSQSNRVDQHNRYTATRMTACLTQP